MWAMCRFGWVVLAAIATTGCVGDIVGVAKEGSGGPPPETEPPDDADAGVAGPRPDAPPFPDAGHGTGPAPGIAPPGAIEGEIQTEDGSTPIRLGVDEAAYRVDVAPGEHVAFALAFSTGTTGVVLSVQRWDGGRAVTLGSSDAGAGLRFLSALDPNDRRTYWALVHADASAAATLTITRTPFSEGSHCTYDCTRLLQLPLPNDPAYDGYDIDDGTVFRYQFGRRDLVMLVRYAARQRARAGKAPIYPYDFSQWDGMTPGTDVGAPRHVSHQRGKDVDVSIYGQDQISIWRSYCTTHDVSGGRECIAGTRKNFDGYETAREIGSGYESGRVTMCFLDRELIAAVAPGASSAANDGLIARALVPLFSDGKHLQHWPNHDNHVHIRVSETEYNAKIDWGFEEPFEAP
jgi:hypothetical protein